MTSSARIDRSQVVCGLFWRVVLMTAKLPSNERERSANANFVTRKFGRRDEITFVTVTTHRGMVGMTGCFVPVEEQRP